VVFGPVSVLRSAVSSIHLPDCDASGRKRNLGSATQI
jgi:hypothetical protein